MSKNSDQVSLKILFCSAEYYVAKTFKELAEIVVKKGCVSFIKIVPILLTTAAVKTDKLKQQKTEIVSILLPAAPELSQFFSLTFRPSNLKHVTCTICWIFGVVVVHFFPSKCRLLKLSAYQ